MIRLPFFRQETDFYCGPAIIQTLVAARGKKISQRQAARAMKTNKKVGTHPKALVDFLKKEGFTMRVGQNRTSRDLKNAIKKDLVPVVLFIEPEAEWDHYAIVRKIEKGVVSLLDPDARTGKTNMLEEEFLRRWKDRDVLQSRHWAAFVDLKITAKPKRR